MEFACSPLELWLLPQSEDKEVKVRSDQKPPTLYKEVQDQRVDTFYTLCNFCRLETRYIRNATCVRRIASRWKKKKKDIYPDASYDANMQEEISTLFSTTPVL